MSLLTEIQNNTSSVVNGKLTLAQAITNKGGTLGDYVLVPSFSNLANGVRNIVAVADIVGASDVQVLAATNLIQGEMCALKKVTSEYSGILVRTLPLTGKYSTSTYNIDYSKPVRVYDNGSMIVTNMVNQGSIIARFFWDGTSYVQKGSGVVYNFVLDAETNHFALVWYNGSYNYLSFYDYDPETAAGTWVCDFKNAATSASAMTYAYKDNFIGEYIWHYNRQAKTYEADIIASEIIGITYSNECHARDIMPTNDGLYLAIFNTYDKATSYLIKTVQDSSGMLKKTGTLFNFTSLTGVASKNVSSPVQFIEHYSKVLYLDVNGKLHLLDLNTTTNQLTHLGYVTFSDGLANANISDYSFTKGNDALYVYVNDTSIESTRRLRLYTYDDLTGEFVFSCYPAETFSPVVKADAVPLTPAYGYIPNAGFDVFFKADGTWAAYNVSAPSLDYTHTAESCNGKLLQGVAVSGYGVSKQNMPSGSIGKVTQILS